MGRRRGGRGWARRRRPVRRKEAAPPIVGWLTIGDGPPLAVTAWSFEPVLATPVGEMAEVLDGLRRRRREWAERD